MARARDVWEILRGNLYLHRAEGDWRVRVVGRYRPRIVSAGRIRLSRGVKLDCRTIPVELVTEKGALLSLGTDVYIGPGSSIHAVDHISIGQDTLIGPNVRIADTNFHGMTAATRFEPDPPSPVIIGRGVWLSTNVVVVPGVTIGDGATVGANAVVTRDVPARTFVAGAPARIISATSSVAA